MHYKFTVQRVNKASFFEVTTSRSCEDVKGFYNVTFGLGGKATTSCVSVRFLVSTFESFLGFLSFPPFVRHFFQQAREPEVKLHHVVYKVWLVSYLFISFQIWYFREWMITSIGQSKHLRVTRFNPLWVSGLTEHDVINTRPRACL